VQFAELFPDSGAPLPLYQPIAVVSSFSVSRVAVVFSRPAGVSLPPSLEVGGLSPLVLAPFPSVYSFPQGFGLSTSEVQFWVLGRGMGPAL